MSIWVKDLKHNLLILARLDISTSVTLDMLEFIKDNDPNLYGDAMIYAIDKNQDRIDTFNSTKKEIRNNASVQKEDNLTDDL